MPHRVGRALEFHECFTRKPIRTRDRLSENTAVTGCNSRAGEAASVGVESPTMLPETEDGLAERRPAKRATDTSGHNAASDPPSFMGLLPIGGRGVFAASLPSSHGHNRKER